MTDDERKAYEAELAKWEGVRLMAGCIAGVEADIDKAAEHGTVDSGSDRQVRPGGAELRARESGQA